MKHKLESRLPGEISITSDKQMTPPLRSWHPITSWQIDGETVETVADFISGGTPKSLQMVTAAMKLKDSCYLKEKL